MDAFSEKIHKLSGGGGGLQNFWREVVLNIFGTFRDQNKNILSTKKVKNVLNIIGSF